MTSRLPRDPDTDAAGIGTGTSDVFRFEPAGPDRLRKRAGTYAAIVVGGFLGGGLRYVLDELFPAPVPQFPWTVLIVNVTGSFLLGLLLVLAIEVWQTGPVVRPLWATGFLGAFTTFSTYVLAVVQLVDAGAWVTGVGYAASSVAAGLAAAWFGLRLGRSLVARVGRPRPVSGWSSDAPGG